VAGGAVLRLAPLGVPLRLEVRGAGPEVRTACDCWEGAGEGPLLELWLTVDPHLTGTGAAEVAVQGSQLTLKGVGARGGARADLRRAWCAVSRDFLAAPERLRAEVLDPLVLFLVTRHGRTPLHAAAVKAGELAILLMGPSGAGKSTLAVTADQAGWTVLSEDTVYIQLEPALKVWGSAGPAHLLSADGEPGQFRLRNGKLKRVIPLRQPLGIHTADRATLCLLARGEAVALERIGPAEALTLVGAPEPGFDLLAEDIRDASERLVRRGAWRLTLSDDAAEAIDLVSRRLPQLRETAVP
jgi:hypothetical protein